MAEKIGIIVMLIGVGIGTAIQIQCFDKVQRKKYLNWAGISWAFIVGGACVGIFI